LNNVGRRLGETQVVLLVGDCPCSRARGEKESCCLGQPLLSLQYLRREEEMDSSRRHREHSCAPNLPGLSVQRTLAQFVVPGVLFDSFLVQDPIGRVT
jgi:hypothetical protein